MHLLLDPLRWLLAAGLAANGLAMLLAPQAWYAAVPGVAYTGPLNTHFVRDIGCAYLASAAGLGAGLAFLFPDPSQEPSPCLTG